MIGSRRLKGEARAEFSEAEVGYLAENFIGRVATASAAGQPHVVPVGYRFDGSSITFGGLNLVKTLKFKNMMSNYRVAFVVDDVVSVKPWRVRGVEVRGKAEAVHAPDGVTMVRIIPLNIRSWGLEG
jgi:pyridoxamine 5'-phosphate oxidase family protein